MAGISYEEGKKKVFQGFIILGVVTIIEVIIALFGNGHIIHGFELPKYIMYPVMIALSLYKAYFIINEFMHMKYEVKGLVMSVILPTLLLIWVIIAFLQEGNSWGKSRKLIKERNEIDVKKTSQILDVKDMELEIRYF